MKKQRVELLLSAFFLSMTLIFLPAAGAASVPETKAAQPTVRTWETDPALVEKWGIEVTSVRLTANGHMIDYRYRILDEAKAESLFKKATKPNLIHQPTGKVLSVPVTAKVGPLRSSYKPQKDRIYWMFFGNPGLVKSGDKVTVVIGEFRVENLVVE